MMVKPLISGLQNTVAVDFYHSPKGDLIFWTDVVEDKIYRGYVISGCKLYFLCEFLFIYFNDICDDLRFFFYIVFYFAIILELKKNIKVQVILISVISNLILPF